MEMPDPSNIRSSRSERNTGAISSVQIIISKCFCSINKIFSILMIQVYISLLIQIIRLRVSVGVRDSEKSPYLQTYDTTIEL